MLTCKITFSDLRHPVIISKNPGFWALHLARRNEFRFPCLINTKKCFSFFGYWLLPEKFSVCPKNNGFARFRRLQPYTPSPGSYTYGFNGIFLQNSKLVIYYLMKSKVYDRWILVHGFVLVAWFSRSGSTVDKGADHQAVQRLVWTRAYLLGLVPRK